MLSARYPGNRMNEKEKCDALMRLPAQIRARTARKANQALRARDPGRRRYVRQGNHLHLAQEARRLAPRLSLAHAPVKRLKEVR